MSNGSTNNGFGRDNASAKLVFHIGYHKTATTWLQSVFIPDAANNLRAIGERFEPRRDIVWPRSFEYDPEQVKGKYLPLLQAATDNGEVPIISDERFSGNPMSGGFDSREIADRLHQTFPHCRIIMVIREQRSMLYSTYDEYVREGGGSDIHRFLFPKSRYCVPPFRFEHFMYDKLIGYYMTLFSAENVLVLPFELLCEAPSNFLRKIVEFCRAKADSVPSDISLVNKSRPAAVLPMERRLNYFIRSDDLNGHSPMAISKADYYVKPALEKVAAWLPRFVERKVKAAIEEEIEAACRGRFQMSNRKTQLLTKLGLQQYGYDC